MKTMVRLILNHLYSPLCFTPYPSDFIFNTSSCDLQKFSGDSAIVDPVSWTLWTGVNAITWTSTQVK